MIIGIGCDIVEHSNTIAMEWQNRPSLKHRVFSQDELLISNTGNEIHFLSGRFAVKEAVLKCLGTGMADGLSLTDINVLQDSEGRPTLQLSGAIKRISDSMGISSWNLSIAHSNLHSVAFVVAERI